MNPTQQQIHQLINENNFSEVFKLLKSQKSHLQEINRLKNTFIQGKHDVDFVQQLKTLTDTIFEDSTLKNDQAEEKQPEIIIQNSKNVIAGNTFGNISGSIQIGDNNGNHEK